MSCRLVFQAGSRSSPQPLLPRQWNRQPLKILAALNRLDGAAAPHRSIHLQEPGPGLLGTQPPPRKRFKRTTARTIPIIHNASICLQAYRTHRRIG